MKTRQDKHKDVESLHEILEKNPTVFVAGFNKLTVDQDFRLRKAVREAGGLYRVVKNTLAEYAARGTPAEGALSGLTGTTSVAYTAADPVTLAKALTQYAKENPAFTFKAGVVEGRVVDASAAQRLAEMPPREEVFAKLLFLIQAPATSLARVLGAAGRNVAVVVDQGCKEGRFPS
jgi:large subunit ribosomal protein L10